MAEDCNMTLRDYRSLLADYEYELAVQTRRGMQAIESLQSAIARMVEVIRTLETAPVAEHASEQTNAG